MPYLLKYASFYLCNENSEDWYFLTIFWKYESKYTPLEKVAEENGDELTEKQGEEGGSEEDRGD